MFLLFCMLKGFGHIILYFLFYLAPNKYCGQRQCAGLFHPFFRNISLMIRYMNNDYASQTFPLASLTSILGDV